MVILAVDTTSRAGSLALARDGRVLVGVEGDPARTHGERLPGDVSALLSRAGMVLRDVDLYAVVTGPGSFTGLRVGIATVQGFALARNRLVVPVPALEAFASADGLPDGRIAVWRDAQRRQVFATLFERHQGQITEILEPVSLPPVEVARAWHAQGVAADAFIGDGVDVYADVIRGTWPDARLTQPTPPLAPLAALMAAHHPGRAVTPHAVIPIYVRATDAELARERNAAQKK